MRSNLAIFIEVYHTTDPYSTCDLASVEYKVFKVSVSFQPLHVRLIRPKILLALLVIVSIWEFQERWWFVSKPRSRNSSTSSRTDPFKVKLEIRGCFFMVIRISLQFLTLRSILFCSLHFRPNCTPLSLIISQRSFLLLTSLYCCCSSNLPVST